MSDPFAAVEQEFKAKIAASAPNQLPKTPSGKNAYRCWGCHRYLFEHKKDGCAGECDASVAMVWSLKLMS